ncbi:MAG: hypothetical protein PHI67_10205 [Candidatus Methanomethylophilaceae archaeon]|nr:hypothetical protein [Candidatus Methanomethylophilaceae archaeon]
METYAIYWRDTGYPTAGRILAFLRERGMASEDLMTEMLGISSRECREFCLELARTRQISYEHHRGTLMWRHLAEEHPWHSLMIYAERGGYIDV